MARADALLGLARAALPAVPVLNRVPGIRKAPADSFEGLSRSGTPTEIDPAHVAAYSRVCGFPRKDTVPLTYPHLLSFDLQMRIMSDPRFPWVAMGMVHVENSLTSHRPLRPGEQVGVTTSVGEPRPHPRGTLLDFRTFVSAGDEVVWESTSTYLRRGPGEETAPPGLDLGAPVEGTATWQLPGDLGRRYAAVSGDYNPIHLYPWTARPLGFGRQIAHGMWSKARCLAAIENRLPDAVRVEVAFRKPILLPATVAFGLEGDGRSEDGLAFSLTRPRDGSPHLLGRARPA